MRKALQKNVEKILCIGSIGKDIFLPMDAGVVQEATPPLRTKKQWAFGYGAKYYVNDRFEAPGGCASNVSTGLARLGCTASAYGMIGDDTDAAWIIHALAHNGVDTKHLITVEGKSTDLACAPVHTDTGERTLFISRDVGEELLIDQKSCKDATWIYIGSLIGKNAVANIDTIHNHVASTKTKLAYNPSMHNLCAQPEKVHDLICHTDILFVNAVEAVEALNIVRKISPKSDSEKIVQTTNSAYNKSSTCNKYSVEIDTGIQLQRCMGSEKIVVLTCGKKGAWIIAQDTSNISKVWHINTREKTALDTTGAGDAFASGFLGGILAGKSLAQSGTWGAANSHNVISAYGGQEGLLMRENIETQAEMFNAKEIIHTT